MPSYTESFDSIPSMTTYGTTEPGQPSIVSGEMQFVARSGYDYWSAILDGSPSVSDFDVTFYFTVGSTANELYSYFWYRTPSMNSTPTTAKYRLQVHRSGSVYLYRESTSIGSYSITANTKTKFRILVSGSSHKVYIDDVLQIDATDSTYTSASKVGIGNYSSASAYGRVSKIDALDMTYSAANTITVSMNACVRGAVYLSLNAVLEPSFYPLSMYYVNKDPQNSAFSAMYITDVQDLDSNHWKHVKRVSVIGDYGDNEIELQWVNNPTYTNWSSLGTKTPTDPSVVQATNWHNLGQARRFALSLTWSGNSNIAHDAIEVRYNIKTR